MNKKLITDLVTTPYRRVWSVWQIVFILGLSILALIAFRSFSQLEREIADFFMVHVGCKTRSNFAPDATLCGYFPWAHDPFPRAVHEALKLPYKLLLAFTIIWFAACVLLRKSSTKVDFRVPLSGLLSFALGVLLTVNFILKEHWGRPRPNQTSDAGGKDTYVLPGTISDQCEGNCSFVSGDASAAFWMFWVVPFIPQKWRLLGFLMITGLALANAFMRVAQGRHYLSDVVLAALITLAIIGVVNWSLGAWKKSG